MSEHEETTDVDEARTVDETIDRVERLYRALTGREPPVVEALSPMPEGIDPQQYVGEQVDRLIDVLERAPIHLGLVPTWTPPISAWEGPKDVLIFVELPGVPREAVEIVVSRNVLTVTGNRPTPVSNGIREYAPRWVEHPLGAFRRAVALPPVMVEQISAAMKNNVLEIRVPKGIKASLTTQAVPIH
ncbi:MAG: Hsp20/alpha crystallin family protein [Pseudomonadota bacterium]